MIFLGGTILLIFCLILLEGFFSGSETVYTSTRKAFIHDLAQPRRQRFDVRVIPTAIPTHVMRRRLALQCLSVHVDEREGRGLGLEELVQMLAHQLGQARLLHLQVPPARRRQA